MGLTKRYKDNQRALTEAEGVALAEIREQGGDDEALSYAAISLCAARDEQDRLRAEIRDLRAQVQRLEFPSLYAEDEPEDEAEIADRIYEAAERAVELMKRARMQGNYDVTFNSMVEIASFRLKLCPPEE